MKFPLSFSNKHHKSNKIQQTQLIGIEMIYEKYNQKHLVVKKGKEAAMALHSVSQWHKCVDATKKIVVTGVMCCNLL